MKLAFLVAQYEPTAASLPLVVDGDVKRAVGGYEEDYGALVLPETKLGGATFDNAGSGVIPLGQLWLRKLTPMVNGSPAEASDLRIVSVFKDGESHRTPLCLLGARKTADGGWELLVFGKGKEPLLRTPLIRKAGEQAMPIELRGERDYDSGKIVLKVVGRFEATIPVTELAE